MPYKFEKFQSKQRYYQTLGSPVPVSEVRQLYAVIQKDVVTQVLVILVKFIFNESPQTCGGFCSMLVFIIV